MGLNRRSLIAAAAGLPLAFAGKGSAEALHTSLAHAGGWRRVRPGEAGWPSEAEWNALGLAVGGSLLQPTSPYLPCLDPKRAPECAATMKQLRNPFYVGDQPGGTQVSGWLNAWSPAASRFAVAARNAQDVAAAVRFARAHRLRLVVKGGGHSYQGTSCAPDSLLVWTRRMNRVELQDAFTPKGCEERIAPTPAVSIQSGAMWIDAYDAVTTRAGRYVQGGGCATVGVAGHIQSGGFGSFSKGFGTAAGNLLEAEIVTADGRVRLVNACRDPELFWALKGGGGGSWGAVTRVTVRSHALPATFGGASFEVMAGSDAAFQRLMDRFLELYATRLMNPHWGEQASFSGDNRLKVSMVVQGLSSRQANETWRPLLSWIRGSPADYKLGDVSIGVGPAREWWDGEARKRRGNTSLIPDPRPGAPAAHAWWDGDSEQVSAFLHGYDSVWLPAALLSAELRPDLVRALFRASRHETVGLHFNKGLAGAEAEVLARESDTAMNPGARSAFALAIVANGGPPPFPAQTPQSLAKALQHAIAVDAALRELRQIAPRGGSYVSESNYFNADWKAAFWGEHTERLARAKAAYDPEGLFYVRHGIGSEAWSEDGFVRLG